MSHPTTAKIEHIRCSPDRNSEFASKFLGWTDLGGYPVLFLAEDGGDLCYRCVNGENGSEVGSDAAILDSETGETDPQWTIAGYHVYYEGPPIICDHCGAETESAYGDPDEID
jgi:hypothetical protein